MNNDSRPDRSGTGFFARIGVAGCVFTLCAVLVGCLSSDTAIFSQSDAEEVPGGAGIWELVDEEKHFRIFVKRAENGSYLAGRSPSSFGGGPDQETTYLAVHLKDGYYVLQALTSQKDFELMLMQLTPKYLIGYEPSQEISESAAQKVGMTLNGHPAVPSGADKIKIKKYFLALTDMVGKIDHRLVYQRKGGFVEKDGAAYDISLASNAYARGDFRTALPIYRYLAERGNAEAQLQVANILAGPLYHPAMAMQVAHQAYASGKSEAAYLLARLYRAGSSDSLTPSGLPSNPDYVEALVWAETAIVENVSKREATAAVIEWSREACDIPALKAKHPDPKECSTSLANLSFEKAKVHHEITSLTESLIAVGLERQAEEKHNADIKRKLQENDEKRRATLKEARQYCELLPKTDPGRSRPLCVEALK